MIIHKNTKIGSIHYIGNIIESAWYEGYKVFPDEAEEEMGEMVLVLNITSNNTTIDLSPWLSAAPGDGTTDIFVDWDDVSSISTRSLNNNFNVYTVEEREDEPIDGDELQEIDKLEIENNNLVALASTDYLVDETNPTAGTISHTYSTAGEYKITLKGSFKWGPGKLITLTSLQATLTSIKLPTNNSPIQFITDYGFYDFTELELIPEGLFDKCTEVTSFYYCFRSCKSLQSIPEGLFDKCTKVSNFYGCFHGCPIQSIPEGLFDNCTKIANFNECFRGCTSLQSIPDGLFDNCINVTNFGFCFYDCSSLQSIPEHLFDNCTKVTSFGGCFSKCLQLQSIPEGLFDKCIEVTDFGTCFSNSTSLQSIPEGLFDSCTEVTRFSYCFNGCSSLQSIPVGLFDKCRKVTNFDYCFQYCSSLQSIPIGLFDKNIAITRFEYCFNGCSSLQSIPDGLFDNCAKVTYFGSCFQDCTSLQSIPDGLFDNCINVTSFRDCFSGCSSVTSKLPTLWISHSSATRSKCFNYCNKAPNYADAYNAGWADDPVPEQDDSGEMVLVLNITNNNTMIDLSPWLSAAPGDGTTDISIDWGDKTSAISVQSLNNQDVTNNFQVYTVEEREDVPIDENTWHLRRNRLKDIDRLEIDNNLVTLASTDYPVTETPSTGTITHTYATAGEYRITLKGSFKWGLGRYYADTTLQNTLTSIELPSGNSPIKYISSEAAFQGCKSLESIPNGLFDNCTEVTSFKGCFDFCSSLQTIPDKLFDNCTEVTDFSGCFGWTSLISIPEGLFDKCTKVTNFYGCFSNSSLQSIPDRLFDNCTEVDDFGWCFDECINLQSIPEKLFDKCTKVTSFSYCFNYCPELESIPDGLFNNCIDVTNFSYCFANCYKLLSIPDGLFNDCIKTLTFSNCFYDCYALTSIPAGLFDKNNLVNDFTNCFTSCVSVTSNLPTLWISHASASHSECFSNCPKAPNYDAAKAAGWA